MKLYVFEPYDVLSFGGLKHFGAGQTHISRSSFPPPIMRFFHLFEKVYGVFIKQQDQLYLPAPADLLKERKKEDSTSVRALKLKGEIPFLSGTDKAYESVGDAFISYEDFTKNYVKRRECLCVYPLEEFIQKEFRVGIGLDKERHIAKESLLYSQEFLRLKNSHLTVLAEGMQQNIKGNIVPVGGERKVAFLKEEPVRLFEGSVRIERGKLYKFYCLSHLYVDGGLKRGKVLKISGMNFSLVWLFNKGVEYVSGFAKPFLQMLKPGSVLVLEALASGGFGCQVCQVESTPPEWRYESFLERGWNSGILWEV